MLNKMKQFGKNKKYWMQMVTIIICNNENKVGV